MNSPGHRRPYLRIALNDRLDLVARQLESLVLQLRKRLERSLDETDAQLFVCEQATDHELNRFLRHRVWLRPLLWQSPRQRVRSEEHTSELQSRLHLVCRLLLEKKKKPAQLPPPHHR